MKRVKQNYSDEPIGKVKIVVDFLPPSEKLVAKKETVKVTLALSKIFVGVINTLRRLLK